MTRFGYQIPNFTHPDGDGGAVGSARVSDLVVAHAKEAEASGFDTVMVMDHFEITVSLQTPAGIGATHEEAVCDRVSLLGETLAKVVG